MTLSPASRLKLLQEALRVLLRELGEQSFDAACIDPHSPPFASLHPNTWEELRQLKLVQRDNEFGEVRYRLTPQGWLEALRAASQWDSEDLDREVGTLSKLFKSKVKGRQAPAKVSLREVASGTGLSEDRIFNIIDSNLLEERSGRRGVQWYGSSKRNIKVPTNFGTEPVEPGDQLRARIAELEGELEDLEGRVSDYLCPYCRSPLTVSTAGDADSETWYRNFECGYAEVDGDTVFPCPYGPEFPAFSEYEVEYRQEHGGIWHCIATPTSERARRVILGGLGFTKDAAREALWQHYAFRAKLDPKTGIRRPPANRSEVAPRD